MGAEHLKHGVVLPGNAPSPPHRRVWAAAIAPLSAQLCRPGSTEALGWSWLLRGVSWSDGVRLVLKESLTAAWLLPAGACAPRPWQGQALVNSELLKQ